MANENDESGGQKESIVVVGTLTDEGIECQALREDKTDKLYTLTKNGGFKRGDHVKVTGPIAEVSICQQGTTISVNTIVKA
jgi:hypothetical protein